jgi:hypothetical protein
MLVRIQSGVQIMRCDMQKGNKLSIMGRFGYPIEVEFIGYSSHNNIENPNRIWVQYEYCYWNNSKRTISVPVDSIIKN